MKNPFVWKLTRNTGPLVVIGILLLWWIINPYLPLSPGVRAYIYHIAH